MDQLVQNFSFEAVAVPQDDVIQLHTANATPIKVKIKMKKGWKSNTGIQQRVFSSTRPRERYTNGYPKKIRMVQSDQTIMSFNMHMEPESTSRSRRKSQNKFFHLFKTGKCLSTQEDEDEDDPPYMPATSDKPDKVETKRLTIGSDNIQQEIGTSQDKSDIQTSKKVIKIPPIFLGKCKPGGCFDPPFSEDKYQYQPSLKPKLNLSLKEKEDGNYKKASCDNKNEKITEQLKKTIVITDQDKTDTSTLMLYKASSEKNNSDGKCSLSTLTYPPKTSSGDLSIPENKTVRNERSTVRSRQLNDGSVTYFGIGKLRKSQDKNSNFNNKEKYNRYIQKAERKRTSSVLLDKNNIVNKENIILKSPQTISQPEYKLLELVQVSENSSINGKQITKPLFASFTPKPDESVMKSEIDIKETNQNQNQKSNNTCSTSNEGIIPNSVKVEGDKASLINIKHISSQGAGHEFDINKIEKANNRHTNSGYSENTKRPSYEVNEDKKYFKLDSLRKSKDKLFANSLTYSDINIKDKQLSRNSSGVKKKLNNEVTINSGLCDAKKNTSKISQEALTRETKLPSCDLNVIQKTENIVDVKKYDGRKSVLILPKQDEHLDEKHMEVSDILDTNQRSDKKLESYDSHIEEEPLNENENTITATQPENYKNNMAEKIIRPESEHCTEVFDVLNSNEMNDNKVVVHDSQEDIHPSTKIESTITAKQHDYYKNNMTEMSKPYQTGHNTRDSNLQSTENMTYSKNDIDHQFVSNVQKPDDLGEYHTEALEVLDHIKKSDKSLQLYEDDNSIKNEDTVTAILPEYYKDNLNEKITPPDSEKYTTFVGVSKSDEINDNKLKVQEAQDYMNPLREVEYSITAISPEHYKGNLDKTIKSNQTKYIMQGTKSQSCDSNMVQSSENIANAKNHDEHKMVSNSLKPDKNLGEHHTVITDILDTDKKFYKKRESHEGHRENNRWIKNEDSTAMQHQKVILPDNENYTEIVDSLNTDEISYKKIINREPQNDTYSPEKNENIITAIKDYKENLLDSSTLEYSKENQILDTRNLVNEHPTGKDVVILPTLRDQDFTHYKSTTPRNSNNLPINVISFKSDSITSKETLSNISSLKEISLPDSKGIITSRGKLLENDELITRDDDFKNGARTNSITKQDTISKSESNHNLEIIYSDVPSKNLTPFNTEDTLPKIFTVKVNNNNTPSPTIEVKNIETKYMINKGGSESLKQSESEQMQNYPKSEFSKTDQISVIGENVQYAKTSEDQIFDQILPITNENMLYNTSATKEYSETYDDNEVPNNISELGFQNRSSNLLSDRISNKLEPSAVMSENVIKAFGGHLSTYTKANFQQTISNHQYDKKKISTPKEIRNLQINKESKDNWVQLKDDTQKTSKGSLKNYNRTTIVDLGFQTYVNEDNEITLRTFDASKEPQRLPQDNITVIKSALTLNDSKLSFAVNYDTNISIKINRNKKLEEKNLEIQGQSSDEIIHRINKDSKMQIDLTDIGTLQKSLSAIYENDLVPVEKIIKTLRLEIDKIVKYRLLVKNKSMVTKKIKQICSYKKCGCLGK